MLLSLLMVFASSSQLQEGLPYSGYLSSRTALNETFSYYYTSSNTDLSIITTVFSDISDLYLYFSNDSSLSASNYQYSIISRNSGGLEIPYQYFIQNSTYFILLICEQYCMYSISLSITIPIALSNGVPVAGSIAQGNSLSFSLNSSNQENFTLISTKFTGKVEISVVSIQNLTENLNLYNVWPDQTEFLSFDNSGEYIIKIFAEEYTKFVIMGLYSQTTPILLQASNTINSFVKLNEYKKYFIVADETFDQIEISLTAFSGNTDLFIGFNDKVDKEFYNFCSKSIGSEIIVLNKDELIRHNFFAGKMFFAVFGAEDSVFSFVVKLGKNSSVKLDDGLPGEFIVSKDKFSSFYFEVGFKPLNVSFYLTSFSGNADIYVKFCESRCFLSNEDLVNESLIKGQGTSISKSLNFYYSSNYTCNSTSLCNLGVFIHGKTQSHFSLVAVTIKSKIFLQQGKAFIIYFPSATNQNFFFSSNSHLINELEFTLTPIYGNPDLCINKEVSDKEYCEKSSNKSGINIDQIRYSLKKENNSLEGQYFIKVICQSACFYSILARELGREKNNSVNLISGFPQNDILLNEPAKDFRIYSFESNSENFDLEIIFLSLTGKYSIYIANNPKNLERVNENFLFDWSFSDEKYIRLSSKDPKFLQNSTFLILVQASRFSTEGLNIFSIQICKKNDEFLLTTDLNIPGQIKSQEFSFYAFPIYFLYQDIKISLTAISGDPDIFISFNSNNIEGNYSITSNTFGSETLIILWEDRTTKYCPELKNEHQSNNPFKCIMYISMYSEYTSTYSIKLSVQTKLPQYIENGGIIHGNLKKNEFEFFYTFIDITKNLCLLLQNFAEGSQLFVNIQDKHKVSAESEDWERPSEGNSLRKVKNLVIEIVQLTDLELREHCESICLVMISVECSKEICSFSLQNIEDDVIKLTEGQSHYGIVGLNFQYYQYTCDKADQTLIVTLTPIESCEPSLYVTIGKEKRPTSTLFDWTSESNSGNFIKINADDAIFINNSMIGTYTIGVTSLYTSCTYTISITNHEIPVVALTPGLPQQGSISNEGIRYYTLFNSLAEHISFSLTPTIGSPYLVLSIHQDDGSQLYSDLPTVDHYIWNSNFAKDKYTLSISSDHLNFCRKCYYVLGVVSSDPTVYTITGTSKLNFKILQNGIPNKGEISPKSWNLYTFNLNYNQKVQISVAEYSNPVDFFVSISTDLNGFIWNALVGNRTKTIYITPNDTNFILGTYYIFVTTDMPDTIYSIVWYRENTNINLIDGWPLMFSLGPVAGNKMEFKFEQPGSLFCMVESLSKEYFPLVDIYIKDKINTGQITYQNFNETFYNGEHLSMDFLVNNSNYLILVIKNPKVSKAINDEFSLYCTKSFHPAFIKVGSTVIGHLSPEKPALRYEINLSNMKTLKVYLVPCEGGVELQASSNWTEIREQDPFFTSIILTNGVIIGKISNIIGKVYLTVKKFSISNTSTFKLFVDDQMLERVYPGNNGLLNLDYYKNNVKIQWNGLEYSNSTKFKGNVIYSLFYTKDFLIPLKTTCQAYFAVSHGKGKWIGSTVGESFSANIKESGYLTVVGRVENQHVVALRDAIYSRVRVEGIKGNHRFGKHVFILLVISIIILIAVAALVSKFRRVKNDLKILETQEKQITEASYVNDANKNEK